MGPRIAANLADLTRYDTIVQECLIAPVVGSKEIIEVERGRLDGSTVVLECDKARAQAIAYSEGPRGGWSKL
mgnify:CR=1 FL=1